MASNRYPDYMANGGPPVPQVTAPILPNQGRVIQTGPIRVLCIADVRGNLRSLNELAKSARADHIIHTGDFGFYDDTSLDRIAEKTLKHVAQYSPLIPDGVKKGIQASNSGPVKSRYSPQELPLSELSSLLRGDFKLEVPVYTVWGACEDVRVLEKFRSAEYKVPNLHIIDEARSMLLEIGGVKLRLLGLGGAVVMHKLFDNGEGRTTIAGGQGTMWTTLLQMGELVDTSNRVYDPTETRIFITHASPAREGILNQLSVTLKADFSISAGLHFRYGSSYNEFSVNPTLDHYRGKLAASKASFNDVWETVKGEVEPAIAQNETQQNLLRNALALVEKMPSTAAGGNPFGGPVPGQGLGQIDESAFKNMWNFNLADAAFGYLVLEIQDGRIGTEMRAQGFNFAHRGVKQQPQGAAQAASGPHSAPTSAPPAQTASPAPTSRQPPTAAPVAPAATGQAPSKQSTPQPQSSSAPKESEKAGGMDGNATTDTERTSPAPKSTGPAGQDIIGLYVMGVHTDDEARNLWKDADRAKFIKVIKWGQHNRVIQFDSEADRDGALEHLPTEYKERSNDDRSRPLVKIFEARPPNNRGAGNWGSSRGGRGGGGGGAGSDLGPGGGYRSDSEGSKRVSSRGPRGRGDRRGRGGRGGFRGEGGGASPAPAAATPAE